MIDLRLGTDTSPAYVYGGAMAAMATGTVGSLLLNDHVPLGRMAAGSALGGTLIGHSLVMLNVVLAPPGEAARVVRGTVFGCGAVALGPMLGTFAAAKLKLQGPVEPWAACAAGLVGTTAFVNAAVIVMSSWLILRGMFVEDGAL